MDKQIAELMKRMIAYDHGSPRRIQHFTKVHDFSVTIGTLEGIDSDTMYILETTAILHDIGIRISKEKYGSSAGMYQELEGPAEAEVILQELGCYTEEQIERIKYLIGHHHSYHDIQGLDYQILVEADFLVNLYENDSDEEAVAAAKEKIFRTKTGTFILEQMFQTKK